MFGCVHWFTPISDADLVTTVIGTVRCSYRLSQHHRKLHTRVETMVVQSRECPSLPIHGQGQRLLPHGLLPLDRAWRWARLDDATPCFYDWWVSLRFSYSDRWNLISSAISILSAVRTSSRTVRLPAHSRSGSSHELIFSESLRYRRLAAHDTRSPSYLRQ